MKLFYLISFLLLLNCSANKVSQNHGFASLENKLDKIDINKTNKNDIINIIGPPSSISDFNKNTWFYIERRKTNQSLYKLGIKKISKNNILIVQFNNKGILENKKLLNLNDMNDLKYVEDITDVSYQNNSYIYGVLSSLREKINAPARKRLKNKKN